MEILVTVTVQIKQFRILLERIAALPQRFRPTYFALGERVRKKEESRVEDAARFKVFVDDRVERVSGCDLIGDKIRYGIFVGPTRTAQHEPTHIGCSVVLRGSRWSTADYEDLLRLLCLVPGVESGDACLRDEWRRRHVYIKDLGDMTIQSTLGVDASAQLPGLYWWTVFSEELVRRHRLDRAELESFAAHSESWRTDDGGVLHAFRLYDLPGDWSKENARVSEFLSRHPSFFSLELVAPVLEAAETKDDFDAVVRPYRAGAFPWEAA